MTKKQVRRYEPQVDDFLPAWINKVGMSLEIGGLIFQNESTDHLVFLPHTRSYGRQISFEPTSEQMTAILKRSDDPVLLVNGQKPWLRKSQYSISGQVQQQVWARDEFRCMFCDQKMGAVQLTVDHFKPLELGGVNDPSNYLSLCRKCNRRKGDQDPESHCIDRKLDYEGLLEWIDKRNQGLEAALPWHLSIF